MAWGFRNPSYTGRPALRSLTLDPSPQVEREDPCRKGLIDSGKMLEASVPLHAVERGARG